MKTILLILIILISNLSNADDNFCKNAKVNNKEHIDEFSQTFCFSSPEFTKMFSLKLYEVNIPYTVYEKGAIGYKKSDKDKVQVIGDELVKEYIKNKNLKMCVTSNQLFQPTV